MLTRWVLAVDYGASVIVAKEGDSAKQGDGTEVMGRDSLRVVSKQGLATEIKVGKCMPSFKVLNQADARPWHFQELLKSKGCWRLVVFAGNVKDPRQKARIEKLGQQLSGKSSFLKRFTPANKRYDAVIEVLTVHSAPRQETTIFDFPAVFRPWDERDGWDYWKIFIDDQSYHEGHAHAYQHYGVDPEKGCTVVLRPDQHVSFVTEVDDYEGIDHFFSGFMVEQNGSFRKGPLEVNGNGGTFVDGGSGQNGVEAGDEAAEETGRS